MSSSEPKTMSHTFKLAPLRNHFIKTPNPPGANALIDMPGDVFVDTEEEVNLIAASLWIMSVEWDKMSEEERPKDKEGMRKWIVKRRSNVIERLARHVEPPFPAITINVIEKDVSALLDELLTQTLPIQEKVVDGSLEKLKGGDDKEDNEKEKIE